MLYFELRAPAEGNHVTSALPILSCLHIDSSGVYNIFAQLHDCDR